MLFSEWLLLENMTVSQFLKQPKYHKMVVNIKNEVLRFVRSKIDGFNSSILSRVINWFVKEIILQELQENPYYSVENMWDTIGDYIASHLTDNTFLSRLNLVDFNYPKMVEASEQWHSDLAAKQRGKGAEGRSIVNLDSVPGFKGWKWIARDQSSCDYEARAMGHCGNSGGNGEDNLYSLRDPDGYPHLTFINSKGVLGEMKGRGNSKPTSKYHPAIVKLLLSPEIGAVRRGGYAPKNNFSLDDLSPEVLQYVKQHKPDIDDPEGFEAKRKNIWDSLKRKARADMYRSRSQSIQGINPDNADQTMATLASPASHSYKHPEKVYDQEIVSDEPAPEVVHKNNIWRMYTELLNSVYNQAKRMHPEQLFQWMDQIIQSFVKMLVERDQKTWQELDNKQFFPHISNIAKLDEMVYRLMQDQPEVMHSAPTRSQYNGRWNDYMKGLGST